jgi:hypothetical protein
VPELDWDEEHEWEQELTSCIQFAYIPEEGALPFSFHFHVTARTPRALEETARIHGVLIARSVGYNPRVRYPNLKEIEETMELGEGFE